MFRSLLSGYSALEGRYDELLAAPGTPRPHWEAFLRSLADREGPQVGQRTKKGFPVRARRAGRRQQLVVATFER